MSRTRSVPRPVPARAGSDRFRDADTTMRFDVPRAVALALLVLIVYVPALRSGFLWDDVSVYLLDNPLVKARDGLFRFWFTTQPTDWYPLTNSLFWAEWHLWGNAPVGYHGINILLHVAVSLLAWRVLVQLAVPGAWVAAALFALHPVNVETAAWISQTKSTLSAALFFASLLFWLRFERASGAVPRSRPAAQETRATAARSQASGGRGSNAPTARGAYVAAVVLFVAAMLAKTSSLMLPAVMLLCAWWRRRHIGRRDLVRLVPFVLAGALLAMVQAWFQHRTPGAAAAAGEPLLARLAAAGWIVWFYVYKALLPIGLTLVYPRWRVDPGSFLAWLPGAAVVLVLAFAWRLRARGGAGPLAGFGWFVVNLVPVMGFVGVGFMAHARVTDHWQYTALLGIVALVAGSAAWLLEPPRNAPLAPRSARRRAPGVLAALVLASCAFLTWRQASLYRSEENLWRDNVAKNSSAWVAHNNLGKVLAVQGRYDEARVHLTEAVRLMPDYSEALVNLGNVLDELGRLPEASLIYGHALQVSPPDPVLHYNLGIVLEKQGKLAEAARQYTTALQLQPEDPDTHLRLAEVLARSGALREAVPHYREALRLQPGRAAAESKLAWILATAQDEQPGDADESLRLATHACQATQYRDPDALDVLAAVYARAGRFAEAADTARRALSRAQEAQSESQAREIAARLRFYEAALSKPAPD